MEALRESLLNLTFQMSRYKRATLDEEELVDSTSEDMEPSSLQVDPAAPHPHLSPYCPTSHFSCRCQPKLIYSLVELRHSG